MQNTIQFIDSHCHLHSIDLSEFDNDLNNVLNAALKEGVTEFLCVSIEVNDIPKLYDIAERFDNVHISVGIHPNVEFDAQHELTVEALVDKSKHARCIAIGETGLDYYRTTSSSAIETQKLRFIRHIDASKHTKKPLIIHTRNAAADTLNLLKHNHNLDIAGVMHCFAEDLNVAYQSIDLNFYISLSGIVTFKNAKNLHEVARCIPLERLLIETDCPYLAPTPFRGKQNHPALVSYVAKAISEIRGISIEEVARATSENFYRCFKI